MNPKLIIKTASATDSALIKDFIYALADFEKLSHECIVTSENLIQSLFGPNPVAKVRLAYWDHQPAGFCLYFYNYSTFLGKNGIHLEDLFVSPEFRGFGIGKSLLLDLVQIAKQENCGRVEWNVLDWNQDAIDFYQKLGAKPLSDWTIFRLDEAAINKLS